MARRPVDPNPWLRTLLVTSRRRHLDTLAAAVERFAEHHGDPSSPAVLDRAAAYRADAAAYAAWAEDGAPVLHVGSTTLWEALFHADELELADQVAELGRRHQRPGRHVWFRLDENNELHLDLDHAGSQS